MDSLQNLYQTFNELKPMLLALFCKTEKERFQTLFTKPRLFKYQNQIKIQQQQKRKIKDQFP